MKIFQPQSSSSGGGIGGFIIANQIAYGSGVNTIAGDGNATRIGSGAFQTDIHSQTYAQGGDSTSNFNSNGVFQANTPGPTGNAITLTFNGTTDTYASVLATWNAGHPSNQATLVQGTGSDVPDAQTITFLGGGVAGFQSGTVSINGSSIQGAGNYMIDSTDSTTAFVGAINNIGLTGNSVLNGSLVALDASNNLGTVFVSPGGFNLFGTDQSTYQTSVQGNSNGLTLGNDSLDIFIQSGNGIGWEDRNTSNSFVLPTASTPSVGEVLGVASISGGVYTLDWQSGGSGSPGGANTNVQYNDSGSFGGDSDFTWDKTTQQFLLSGAGGGFFNAQYNGGNPTLFLGANGFGNSTLLTVSDSTSIISAFGNQAISYPTPTVNFVGGGLDDFILNGGFSGSGTVTYILTIDGLSKPYFSISSITGTFVIGETITGGTSSATGVIAGLNDNGTVLVLAPGAGAFMIGETITGGTSSATGTLDVASNTDTFTWTDGTTTLHFVPILSGTGEVLSNDVSTDFSADTGHTLGNNWTFTYAPTTSYGNMLSLDGQNNVFKIGDVDEVGDGTRTEWHQGDKGGIFNYISDVSGNAGEFTVETLAGKILDMATDPAASGQFTFQLNNPYLSGGFPALVVQSDSTGIGMQIFLDDTSGQNIIQLGDTGHTGNSTTLQVNDANQQIQATSDINWSIANFVSFRNPANTTENFFNANWNSGNPVVNFGDFGGGNGTKFELTDSSGIIRATTDTSFTVANTSGDLVLFAQNDGGDHRFRAGDVSAVFNGTLFDVSDDNQYIKAQTVGDVSLGDGAGLGNNTQWQLSDTTKSMLGTADNFQFQNRLGNYWAEINPSLSKVSLGDLTGTGNSTTFVVNDITENITSTGTIVEANIGSTTYGGTLNYSAGFAGKARAFFSGSHSGTATGLLLPTGVNAPIGTKFTIDDLGGLATTDPITIDAGTSNSITSTTGTAQTFVLNVSGESVSIIKLTSTDWMIE